MSIAFIAAPALRTSGAGDWNDREIQRFIKRAALFMRRGQTEERAEQLAERLVARDRDIDDRRVCIECAHLRHTGVCNAARRGLLPGVSASLVPVIDVLARCPRFEWQQP
jgi:hypothetical protein